jgi:DNA invertase Pin-like site-specific DNA recombinase
MTVGRMAANVLAYSAEGERSVISRRTARGQASERVAGAADEVLAATPDS